MLRLQESSIFAEFAKEENHDQGILAELPYKGRMDLFFLVRLPWEESDGLCNFAFDLFRLPLLFGLVPTSFKLLDDAGMLSTKCLTFSDSSSSI